MITNVNVSRCGDLDDR